MRRLPTGRTLRLPRTWLNTITWLAISLVQSGCVAFRTSLPKLSGTSKLPGLSATVLVERDTAGIPTVTADNRLDLAIATGFLHGQDRFFQMDVFRRGAAGELAALLGEAVLAQDVQVRIHGLRRIARQSVERLPESHRRILEAYVSGVNQGLASLGSRPPEYILLRQKPIPWKPEDSILVLHAMGLVLSDAEGFEESSLGIMKRALSPAALAFFAPPGTSWDAALDGSQFPPPHMPTAREFNAPPGRRRNLASVENELVDDPPRLGSNAFAVAGWRSHSQSDSNRSQEGPAWVANDMHLELHLPNTWYRMKWHWNGGTNSMTGASLPGSPAMIIGSNGRVAWGFTAAALDTSDVIRLRMDSGRPGTYLGKNGWTAFESREERIDVRGGKPIQFSVRFTEWGPVIRPSPDIPALKRSEIGTFLQTFATNLSAPRIPPSKGTRPKRIVSTNAIAESASPGRPRQRTTGWEAIRWVMHAPEAANLGLLDFENCRTASDILQAAPKAGLPWLNVLAGDNEGHIGWTVGGWFPRRKGLDGRFPKNWATNEIAWDGWLTPEEYPRLLDPADGILWSANQRKTSEPRYLGLGLGTTVDLGARAQQIRDDLRALDRITPEDLLKVQLDDRAIFLENWHGLLAEVLKSSTTTNRALLAEWQLHVGAWAGRASIDSVGYRLVRAFRNTTLRLLFEPVQDACRRVDPAFSWMPTQFEDSAMRMIREKPAHLLNQRFKSYETLLDFAWQDTMNRFPKPDKPLAQRTWGDRNTLKIQHPFGRASAWLGKLVDAPPIPLPGDSHMPRVQADGIGASQRMVVAPGLEPEGIFHQPGGSSGHFQSRFYLAGHEDWVLGRKSPFLPGPTRYQLKLHP